MVDRSWRQFMETGKVEDYLKFKMKAEEVQKEKISGEVEENRREKLSAGYYKGDSNCSR